MTPPIGQRLHVVGTTCSGKSTLAARLADALQVSVVELDALNWQPGWVALTETDPEAFETRLKEATAGDGWVVAGDYSGFTRRLCWRWASVSPAQRRAQRRTTLSIRRCLCPVRRRLHGAVTELEGGDHLAVGIVRGQIDGVAVDADMIEVGVG
ncbi:MAG: hypothetical protein VCF24_07915 [Candidatus Latescibacterota bacterium]|jgi:hypothetical protein